MRQCGGCPVCRAARLPVQRPGLPAIAYRAGTHATFLAAMKERLSSIAHPELAALTTREASDPSIALLDAWATVADVLTFYQERIANECYLRTATERRSIVELARLVGYEPRPGVAASVHVAFSLEKNYEPVIIPAGAGIQSLPSNGEMPQRFETSHALEARDVWNNLAPRLTRPQRFEPGEQTDALDLAGTSTRLKPDDRVLFVFHGADPESRRLRSVELIAAESRTRIYFQQPDRASDDDDDDDDRSEHCPSEDDRDDGVDTLGLENILLPLARQPSRPPRSPQRLERAPVTMFARRASIGPELLVAMNPRLEGTLHRAWANLDVSCPASLDSVHAMRVRAAPFGHHAQPQPILDDQGRMLGQREWPLADETEILVDLSRAFPSENMVAVSIHSGTHKIGGTLKSGDRLSLPGTDTNVDVSIGGMDPDAYSPYARVTIERRAELTIRFNTEGLITVGVYDQSRDQYVERTTVSVGINDVQWATIDGALLLAHLRDESISIAYRFPNAVPRDNIIHLDASYDSIVPGSWAIIERPGPDQAEVYSILNVATVSMAAYGLSGRVTQLTLDREWLRESDRSLADIRGITVFVRSEPMTLAEKPIEEDIAGDTIALGALYDGLESGRWLIVSGERSDIPGTSGVRAAELVMLANVTQYVDRDLPGDTVHTILHLAEPLAYQYARSTVIVYGNVARATHGQSRSETLGSGDASKTFQQFTLSQPVTYIAAVTPSGAESTLRVLVNDILWREVDSLAELGPVDRAYVTERDQNEQLTVVFGDGEHGARLPTGAENVRSAYRAGLGKAGNVAAEKITQVVAGQPGVQKVTNPLPATGGADPETLDQARRNVPLTTMALDRLVSVEDYAYFARTFAGIAKASAVRIQGHQQSIVHLTIAGADDIPIDESSDLHANLVETLHRFGDPDVPLMVDARELLLLIISANVKLLPDYLWDSTEPRIRAALLDFFHFERRDLGQDVLLSEVIYTIQSVPGVDYVDVDILDHVSEGITPEELMNLFQGLERNERIPVELAGFRDDGAGTDAGPMPAQLAYLTPAIPDTLILRRIDA